MISHNKEIINSWIVKLNKLEVQIQESTPENGMAFELWLDEVFMPSLDGIWSESLKNGMKEELLKNSVNSCPLAARIFHQWNNLEVKSIL